MKVRGPGPTRARCLLHTRIRLLNTYHHYVVTQIKNREPENRSKNGEHAEKGAVEDPRRRTTTLRASGGHLTRTLVSSSHAIQQSIFQAGEQFLQNQNGGGNNGGGGGGGGGLNLQSLGGIVQHASNNDQGGSGNQELFSRGE